MGFWHTFAMTRIASAEFRCLLGARGVRFLFCVVGLSGLLVGASLLAQDVAKPGDEPVPTLHVYANLIQVPTLVLESSRKRISKPIAENRFLVSIDNGHWFPATHVRQEGDDPISLSILLDVSGETVEFMPEINEAIAGLAPTSLHPKDHISIYALDCSLVKSLTDAPAGSEAMRVGVNEALRSWKDRMRSHEKRCEQSVHLWDALALLSGELSKLPGRRVILAITNGHDLGSDSKWNEVRGLAEARGVAVFGLSYVPRYARDAKETLLSWSSEDPFHNICELSGGVVLLANTRLLGEALTQFVAMLRERYIVEFPRPAKATAGEHVKEIRIVNGSNYFIRPAGVSVPIPDAAVLADPTTVPSDPTHTPEMGTRKVMTKPQ